MEDEILRELEATYQMNKQPIAPCADALPNFLCVGAQKAATSTFSDMLRLHPDVYTPELKELHYFDQPNCTKESQKQYSRHFKHAEHYRIRAEFTPNYLSNKNAALEIATQLGTDTKILIILRNPVDRAFSAYSMFRNERMEVRSFEDSFAYETTVLQHNTAHETCNGYFNMGLYSKQVQRYLGLFKFVKIVLYEDFIQETDREMSEIYDFLEINAMKIPLLNANESKRIKSTRLHSIMVYFAQILKKHGAFNRNSIIRKAGAHIRNLNTDTSKPKAKIDPAFAKVLQDYYHDDICELEKLIGRDLTAWKTKY